MNLAQQTVRVEREVELVRRVRLAFELVGELRVDRRAFTIESVAHLGEGGVEGVRVGARGR